MSSKRRDKFGGLRKIPRVDEVKSEETATEEDIPSEVVSLEEQLRQNTVITDGETSIPTTPASSIEEDDMEEEPAYLSEIPKKQENPILKTLEKHVEKDVPTFDETGIYKSKIEELTVEIDNLNGMLNRLRQENEDLTLKLAQTEFEKTNYLEQLNQVSSEITRLRSTAQINNRPQRRYNSVVDQNGYQSWN